MPMFWATEGEKCGEQVTFPSGCDAQVAYRHLGYYSIGGELNQKVTVSYKENLEMKATAGRPCALLKLMRVERRQFCHQKEESRIRLCHSVNSFLQNSSEAIG